MFSGSNSSELHHLIQRWKNANSHPAAVLVAHQPEPPPSFALHYPAAGVAVLPPAPIPVASHNPIALAIQQGKLAQLVHEQRQRVKAALLQGLGAAAAAATATPLLSQGGWFGGGGVPQEYISHQQESFGLKSLPLAASRTPEHVLSATVPTSFGLEAAMEAMISTSAITKTAATSPPMYDIVPLKPKPIRKLKRKKPKDMPKRPLSAYNIFFRDERANLLTKKDASSNCRDSSNLVKASFIIKNKNGNYKNICKKKKQIHKHKKADSSDKTQKVGFESMAKIVSLKWKSIDSKKLEHYKVLAAVERERYNQEMDKYRRRFLPKQEEENAGSKEEN